MKLPNEVLTVTELNNQIKNCLENSNQFHFIHLQGEVSNIRFQSSGHIYFNLKDNESRISSVIFSRTAGGLEIKPKDGDLVVVLASISVYPPYGSYQLIIHDMEYAGNGAILINLEKLKNKLKLEGLFDESRKRTINQYPLSIGLVTSYPSAAAEDLIKNITRRYPLCDIYVFPTLVQGESAPKNIIAQLENAYTYPLTTLIIARGGGSNEDLGAFNDEALVRFVAKSPIPVISAIGHEIDFTLVDFVSDKRASTPTGAAELATVNIDDITYHIEECKSRLENVMLKLIKDNKDKLASFKKMTIFSKPQLLYQQKINDLFIIKQQLINDFKNIQSTNLTKIKLAKNNLYNAMFNYIQYTHLNIENYKDKIRVLNPSSILNRGFAYITNNEGQIISDIDSINSNDIMKTILKNGTITSEVIEKEKRPNGK